MLLNEPTARLSSHASFELQGQRTRYNSIDCSFSERTKVMLERKHSTDIVLEILVLFTHVSEDNIIVRSRFVKTTVEVFVIIK